MASKSPGPQVFRVFAALLAFCMLVAARQHVVVGALSVTTCPCVSAPASVDTASDDAALEVELDDDGQDDQDDDNGDHAAWLGAPCAMLSAPRERVATLGAASPRPAQPDCAGDAEPPRRDA